MFRHANIMYLSLGEVQEITEVNWSKSRIVLLVSVLCLGAGLIGCGSASPPAAELAVPAAQTLAQTERYVVVAKDGIEVACPEDWPPQPDSGSDPGLLYSVSHSPYIRITVAVLAALPNSYYEGLVSAGTVTRVEVNGYPTYENQYQYDYSGSKLISLCYTVHQGPKVCHIMVLCDVQLLDAYTPVFQYVLNSVKFTPNA